MNIIYKNFVFYMSKKKSIIKTLIYWKKMLSDERYDKEILLISSSEVQSTLITICGTKDFTLI